MPTELIKGAHFVLADLFKLNPGSSSQAVSISNDQAEATKGVLVKSARATQPQSPRPAPRLAKKKKENRTRARKTKAASTGLEDFVNWRGIISNELAEEEKMSGLAIRFVVRMRKRVVGSEGETTPKSGGKRLRRSSPYEEAQKD